MVLRRIDDTPVSEGDKPFINKMSAEDFAAVVDKSFFIREVIVCDSGYLILTSVFKGFIFADSEMYKFLSEALTHWTTKAEPSYPLFALVLKTKKITLAIDDDAMDSSWIASGIRYLQSQSPLDASYSTTVKSNPLLPPTKLVPSGRTQRQKSATPTPTTEGH